jgi:hypothetical protein
MPVAPVRSAALLALALAAPVALAGSVTSHFTCRVTNTSRLDHLGRDGQPAELSQFTCRVRGGLLDGFIATGTNIWEPGKSRAVLIGSIVVARKAQAAVVYEVQQATRTLTGAEGPAARWEGVGRGTYKLATGSAAALAGKSFRSVARDDGPGAFTIDATITE